jgi:hypothetical protein
MMKRKFFEKVPKRIRKQMQTGMDRDGQDQNSQQDAGQKHCSLNPSVLFLP